LKEVFGEFKNEKENYDTRTKYNIRDSDGTLILVPKVPLPSEINDGTVLTIREVQKQNKPYLLADLSRQPQENAEIIIKWVQAHHIEILNLAGPRESSCPGIYKSCLTVLITILPRLKSSTCSRF
jgi:hypothetical protein